MARQRASQEGGTHMNTLRCEVVGVRSGLATRVAEFDLPERGVWMLEGKLGPRPLSPRALDLLDLVGGIYRVESRIPRRPTNPAREWYIEAPVRDVAFWAGSGGAKLASVLAFLNRARWTFRFVRRRGAHEVAYETSPESVVREVVLFSGGMDSTCGAGVHRGARRHVQLVSYYSNQRGLQCHLAEELGYPPPVQWRLHGQRGKEGMDLVRSLMFLSLGGIVAESFGAPLVYQYENGILAMAIPPAGTMVPTRHAHPELHRRVESLWEAVFDRPVKIRNPFSLFTKRQVVEQFAKKVGAKRADEILLQTQTCWRLAQAHVGGKRKQPGTPCGVCTPCIVRRTARPFEAKRVGEWPGYAYDLKKPFVQRHEKLGLTFRAYIELVSIVLNTPGDAAMIDQLAPEARTLVGGPAGPSDTEAAAVLRRFATEFCDTFDVRLERGTA